MVKKIRNRLVFVDMDLHKNYLQVAVLDAITLMSDMRLAVFELGFVFVPVILAS